MPLREYQCDACGHRFEVIQKMSDAPLDTCPKCGGVLRKLQAAPAFHLKGTGWYVTDYAKQDSSSSKKEDAAKGATEKGSTEKGATEKSEAHGTQGTQGTKTDAAKSTTSSDSGSSSSSTTPSPAPSSTKDTKPS